MADWIKVEVNSSQKIEVLTMADILDMDEHMVFGKLVVLWCWADANTIDGNANSVTKRMINRVACNDKFADAMLDPRVGWLIEDKNGCVSFPNFDRHNGKGAKKRASTAQRVKQHRENVTISDDNCNTESVTAPLPDKRREEKNIKESKSSRFAPPSIKDIYDYMIEKGFDSLQEAERFFYFYDSKGWVVGKTKMKNWKSAVSRWIGDKKPPVKQKNQTNYDHEAARQAEIEAIRRGLND